MKFIAEITGKLSYIRALKQIKLLFQKNRGSSWKITFEIIEEEVANDKAN
jgi:hypothetical protein